MIDDRGYLVFNKTAVLEGGYDESSLLERCIYQEIYRPLNDDFSVNYSPERKMTGRDIPTTDFIYVQCKNNFGVIFYRDFHAFARRNPSVFRFQNDKELGVAVIGLDSMSRLNFMRQLAKSYRYITEQVSGTVLLGFNKVGENTFPNVIPMLTGHPPPNSNFESFMDWPLIWTHFAQAGAATMYSEDLPEFNMFDYLVSSGIKEQPTHHYMRTFWIAVENSILYKMSSTYCLGPQPKHIIFFEYVKSFLKVYRDSPVFLFSLFNEASHDYVNTVGAIDDDFHSFLKSSFEDNLFNRTVTIVLGDHGNRIDKIRNTDVGRIEDMMPMVTVILPDWVDKEYPKWRTALQENSRRLTSTYDLHATFQNVLVTLKNSDKVKYNIRDSRMSERLKKHFSGVERGVSFFTDVPKTRICSDAGIPDWFCVCQMDEEQLDNSDPRGIAAAQSVINYFNHVMLKDLSNMCAVQKLETVERVNLLLNKDNDRNFKILVRFRTEPGGGVFEATVEANLKTVSDDLMYKVVGDIFRVNRYGDQANCLPKEIRANSTLLRGVCYCL